MVFISATRVTIPSPVSSATRLVFMRWTQFRRRFSLTFAVTAGIAVLFMIVVTNLTGGGFTVWFLASFLLVVVVAVSLLAAVLIP